MKCDTVGATHKYNYMVGRDGALKKYRKYKYSEENRDNIS